MPRQYQCEKCGKRYRVEAKMAGRRVRCKICGHVERLTDVLGAGDVSESGSPIYRHEPRKKGFTLAIGDSESIERISGHIEKHVGPVASVFHEIVSDLVHIDVHQVAPSADRPYWTLVTSGMSDLPMATPPGASVSPRLELMISLPPRWALGQPDFDDEANYWPIRWLKMLARMPHEYDTWIGPGHTIPNGDPAEPFAANTKFCCVLITYPKLVPEAFQRLEIDDGETIDFLALTPIYREEMIFKLKRGGDELDALLDRADVTELLDVKRKNVCKKTWPF